MGHTSSTVRKFERLLEDTRDQLSTVRDTYSQLERTESIPDWFIQSIGDLDRELDDLNKKLEVSEQDIRTAEQTARRVTTLAGVIDAFRERQRTIAEAATERVCTTLSIIADQIQENGLSPDTSPSLDTLQQQCSMLETLIENERYAQVLQHDRVSPRSIEPRIRELDESLPIPERTHARVHLDIVSKLLDGIHESLAMLGEENDDRMAYRDDLEEIKSEIDEVEERLQSDNVPSPEQTTRHLLDDCLRMSDLVAQAAADQRLADTLAETIQEGDFIVDCDVAACKKAGDGEKLLDELGNEITSKAELSEAKRLEQLLVEHDGSVVRTAEATDYTVDAIIEELSQLYQAGNVADVHVEFGK
jgi:hypothetical protein